MLFPVQRTALAIKRRGPSDYDATSDDPYFVYRFWLWRPAYMVLFIQSLDHHYLDPKIFCDRGNDFDESTAVSLRHAAAFAISIFISPPRQLSKIRIDPCSRRGPFRYWARFARTRAQATELLARAKRCGGSEFVTYDLVIDGAREESAGPNRATNIGEHFAGVVRLAACTAPAIDPSFIKEAPLISFVVPTYNTSKTFLDDLLNSFRQQPAGAAELILCDDGSTSTETLAWLSRPHATPGVKILRNAENRGIASVTNAGIAAARGRWVGFIDHDDALTPGVVQLVAQAAQDHPDCKFIYTDEVITNEKLEPLYYFFKPAFDEVLLSGVNYINHLSCYRRERLLAFDGLRTGFDGSQDYDLLLRYLRDLKPEEIKHLPYPGYRWRRTTDTFSTKFLGLATKNARKALAERYGLDKTASPIEDALSPGLHRIRFDKLYDQWPRVSVIIPNRDSFTLISRVIDDLTNKTDYPNLEIIVVDNGTSDEKVLNLYDRSRDSGVPFRCDIEPAPFNFSRQVNRGISLATGSFVLLLNNDVEVTESGWLREMVSCFVYEQTGIVGARLLYPNRHIQHAGVIVGLDGLAGHWFMNQPDTFPGPMGRLHVRQSLTAVTGACMLVSKDCAERVGPFDEQAFPIAYSDVNFCLRASTLGYRIVWTPFATLIHHESMSRGSDETPANYDRFEKYKKNLRQRHHTEGFEDRAFNPWYTHFGVNPMPTFLDRLPKAR
jgi:O-antigen biosynthesis protein